MVWEVAPFIGKLTVWTEDRGSVRFRCDPGHLADDAGSLPGRNGVAILSKVAPLDVRAGIVGVRSTTRAATSRSTWTSTGGG
jgi:hypothetical protein